MSNRTLNYVADFTFFFAVGSLSYLTYYVFRQGVKKGRSLSEN